MPLLATAENSFTKGSCREHAAGSARVLLNLGPELIYLFIDLWQVEVSTP